jgi:hypothetical protein
LFLRAKSPLTYSKSKSTHWVCHFRFEVALNLITLKMVCTLFACPHQCYLFFNFVVLKFWQFFFQNPKLVGLNPNPKKLPKLFGNLKKKIDQFFSKIQKLLWSPKKRKTWNMEHRTMRLVKYHHMGRSLWVTNHKVHNISLLIPFWKSCCIFNSTNSMSNYLKVGTPFKL